MRPSGVLELGCGCAPVAGLACELVEFLRFASDEEASITGLEAKLEALSTNR